MIFSTILKIVFLRQGVRALYIVQAGFRFSDPPTLASPMLELQARATSLSSLSHSDFYTLNVVNEKGYS